MEYTHETIINLPRERVIELFDEPDNLFEWQGGLEAFEHVSGSSGQPGAKSRLLYKVNGREVELIETIEKRDLPDEFTGTYETSGVWNRIVNRFYEDGPDRTRWVVETEFKFGGMMKLMAPFMGGTFRKQTEKNMQDFKEFAERKG